MQWCFSQVKGTLDEDLTEGKNSKFLRLFTVTYKLTVVTLIEDVLMYRFCFLKPKICSFWIILLKCSLYLLASV